MSKRYLLPAFFLLLTPLSLFAAPPSSSKASNSEEASTTFNVAKATQIPGKTLSPGSYSIKIVDHLTDRMIVRIDRNGKAESTFLALSTGALGDAKGPVLLGDGASGKPALRGFVFGSGVTAEFVYPKADAVNLAKANGVTIPAIDPASQGMDGNPALSKTDREMVTLWMLSPTPVGPDSTGPGIKAERYKQVASATTPPRPHQKPLVESLPHTASEMPAGFLLSLLSLGTATYLYRRRTANIC